MSESMLDIDQLTTEQRLELIERLWHSLSATPEAVPLTEAQREELDRRLEDLEREGPRGIPWDEVARHIRKHSQPDNRNTPPVCGGSRGE